MTESEEFHTVLTSLTSFTPLFFVRASANLIKMLLSIFGCSVLCGACHVLADKLCIKRSWLASSTEADRSLAIQSAVGGAVSLVIFLFYLAGLFEASDWSPTMFSDAAASHRAFVKNDYIVAGLSWNLGMVLYETFLYCIYGKELFIFAHHVLGIVVVSLALYSGTWGYFVSWCGLAEFTNMPLSLHTILGIVGLKEHPLYSSNVLVLWAGFLMTRVISMAFCAWRLSRDLFVTLPKLDALDRVNPVLRYLLLPSNLFLWGISCHWFRKITLGILKAIGLIKPKASSGKGKKGE